MAPCTPLHSTLPMFARPLRIDSVPRSTINSALARVSIGQVDTKAGSLPEAGLLGT